MNTVILLGRFTADPEVRYMDNEDQTAYVNFTIAVTREYDREKADFIRCKAFGKLAEIIGDYMKKGSQALLRGSWETGSYEDKKGNTVYTNDCRIEKLDFVGSKASDGDDEPKEKKETRKGSGRSGRR